MLPKLSPKNLFALYALCPALLALAAALVSSKAYWGYYFTRPGLNQRIIEAPTYSSLTVFKSPSGAMTATSLVRDEESSPAEMLASVHEDAYYFEHLNILEEVGRRGLLSALPPMSNERLSRVLVAIKGSGALEPPTPGYERWQYLNGITLEARDQGGARLLFIGAHGGAVSNDHYPSYRFLFEEVADGEFRLLDSSRYFTDAAGIEGAEWPVLFLFFALPAYLLGLPILTLARARLRRAPSEPKMKALA